ncbi:conserved hypothetical protein [Candidatus Sulfopaludibacter sp. SbA4]|nr:conserved hypothetical protein [Candidatus Sulfopaludibacter sp. SbA4]
MGATLRNIQARFGDRPQIGKFFRARGTDSVATLFTLTSKTQGGKRITGMVMVSMLGGNQAGAAVMYDDAARFGKTANALFQKLSEALRPAANQSTGAPARASSFPALRRTPFPDGSGSIGLPAGWRITSAGAGSVRASGPNGESVALAVIYQIYDPSWISYLTANGRPVPLEATIYRYQGDLLGAWLAVGQQSAQKQHQPIPTFVATSTTKLSQDSLLVMGELDFHDGKGPLVSKIQLGKMTSVTSWGMMVHRLSVPKRLVNEEWATVTAIKDTLNQNQAALDQMVRAKQAEISAIGQAASDRARVEGEAHDRYNQSVRAVWDEQNRAGKAFENYQLDRSQVKDNDTGEHATLANPDADWLVKVNPNRFEIVEPGKYLPGVDFRQFSVTSLARSALA